LYYYYYYYYDVIIYLCGPIGDGTGIGSSTIKGPNNNITAANIHPAPTLYTLCSEKNTLTFSSISPWKMFRFAQNFQGMFKMNKVFHRRKS